jgi:hypothetical protein
MRILVVERESAWLIWRTNLQSISRNAINKEIANDRHLRYNLSDYKLCKLSTLSKGRTGKLYRSARPIGDTTCCVLQE